jgi:hypothetical protein
METAHNATFEVRIDGQMVASFDWNHFDQGVGHDVMEHQKIVVDGTNLGDGTNHQIQLVDTTAEDARFVGFSVDTIQVHDWAAAAIRLPLPPRHQILPMPDPDAMFGQPRLQGLKTGNRTPRCFGGDLLARRHSAPPPDRRKARGE